MKFRLFIRITLIIILVLLCVGLGVYSFLRLDAVENKQEFNLYTLVPQDAIAVVETDRMAELVEEINNLQCSRNNHFLYISELFVYLKNYLYTLVGDTPHGFSKQMNKMLLSFHEPDNPLNQVLYCTLGAGDYELVESFVQKYVANTSPPTKFTYQKEEICVYPVADGRFLSVYFTSDFLAISFQKKLIEQVIDALHHKTSLMDIPTFRTMHEGRRAHAMATVYVRMKSVDMGKGNEEGLQQTEIGSWAEFDMKFNENAIYCSGISYGTDTTQTFINALRRQEPVGDFPGEHLPASTFFFDHFAMSDFEAIFDFTSRQEYTKNNYSDSVKVNDREWMALLKEFAGNNVLSCLFYPKDSLTERPCAVIAIPIKEEKQAEQRLQTLLDNSSLAGENVGDYAYYLLPLNTLLTQLTGIDKSTHYTYVSFYRNYMLLAPDTQSLSAYIDALERREVLDETAAYEEGVGSLSPLYNFVMMMDMEEMLHQPDDYVRLVPNFFFRQSKFFRHFVLAIQFIYVDKVIYPNIVLLYKG